MSVSRETTIWCDIGAETDNRCGSWVQYGQGDAATISQARELARSIGWRRKRLNPGEPLSDICTRHPKLV